MSTYYVHLSGTMRYTASVEIEADTLAEAVEKAKLAEKEASEGNGWEVFWDVSTDGIDDERIDYVSSDDDEETWWPTPLEGEVRT